MICDFAHIRTGNRDHAETRQKPQRIEAGKYLRVPVPKLPLVAFGIDA